MSRELAIASAIAGIVYFGINALFLSDAPYGALVGRSVMFALIFGLVSWAMRSLKAKK
ncbi:hypothetical protein Z946_3965 [Sulfitobacter noctilucicola]|uniref:Uncharacterized protein n=1 Tax=Sulfitobacter noctilucicola TaxID=1342301 RepID=A0A7W6M7C2_9RHOB|nr:hypothetical protein [Sulfitobacter noctilucicola]KIN65066.1 hypothetical protein Z946_3965 [Sulfitobacter noctilucicola]MBB4173794.1 hypothetical protein [Sulfitobacter noctilucicola]